MFKLRSILQEVGRRHVARVALVYAAVAFAALEAADIVIPALGLPDQAIRWVIALAFLGFPVTLVLASPNPLLDDEVGNPEWTAHPETGEAGLAFWYELEVKHGGGNAPIEPGWWITDVLPPELLFLDWKSWSGLR